MSGKDTDKSSVASVKYTLRTNGSMDFQASGTFDPAHIQNITRLFGASPPPTGVALITISPRLPSPLLRHLIHEINVGYSLQLFTSTWVCLRKLLENLIIELLRKKFGGSDVGLYYWTGQHRFHAFSVLIRNFESRASDFGTYTDGFDQIFFDFLKKFKRRANTNAHSIDVLQDTSKIDDIRNTVNDCIGLLCTVIERIPS